MRDCPRSPTMAPPLIPYPPFYSAMSTEEKVTPQVAKLKGPLKRGDFHAFMREIVSDEDVNDRAIDNVFDLFDKDSDNILSESETEAVNRIVISAINDIRTAFIVVDFQNDFVSGSLAIGKGGAKQNPVDALAPLNRLLTTTPSFNTIIYTLDWHPSNHISFYEHCRNSDRTLTHSDRQRKLKPFDTVTFETPPLRQVRGTSGSSPISTLYRCYTLDTVFKKDAKYIHKGFEVYVDSYSAFYNNNKTQRYTSTKVSKGQLNGVYRSDLERMLRSENIHAVFVCGLAHDICVAATAHDALDLGFLTAVVQDCR
uniref:nicotinamidase n=1 Tax=Steinernema glaseri TaxID=37863 RepID=A0A1I7ZI77_9BILA